MTGDHSLNFDYFCLTCKGQRAQLKTSPYPMREVHEWSIGIFRMYFKEKKYQTKPNIRPTNTQFESNPAKLELANPQVALLPFTANMTSLPSVETLPCAPSGDPWGQNKYMKITVNSMKLTTPFAKLKTS